MKKLRPILCAAAMTLLPIAAMAGTGPSSSGTVPCNLVIDSWLAVNVPSSLTVTVTGLNLVSGSYVGSGSASGLVTVYSNCATGGTIGVNIVPNSNNPSGVTWAALLASGTYPFGTSTDNLTVTASNITLADAAGTYTGGATATVTVTNAS